jgi:ATP-dependent DNA ligase
MWRWEHGRILVFAHADHQRHITANATEELKLDGFRALAYLDNGGGRLVSRNGNTFASYKELAVDVAAAFRGTDAVLDGEIVCLDERGYPQFEDLMFRHRELFFVAFDALWIDGEDLRNVPLLERKRRLRRVVPSKSGSMLECGRRTGRWIGLIPKIHRCDKTGVQSEYVENFAVR